MTEDWFFQNYVRLAQENAALLTMINAAKQAGVKTLVFSHNSTLLE